jgi:hypothetical protein
MIETSEWIVRLKNLVPFMDAASARQDHHMEARYSKEILELAGRIYGASSANEEEVYRIRQLDAWIAARKAEIAALEPVEDE